MYQKPAEIRLKVTISQPLNDLSQSPRICDVGFTSWNDKTGYACVFCRAAHALNRCARIFLNAANGRKMGTRRVYLKRPQRRRTSTRYGMLAQQVRVACLREIAGRRRSFAWMNATGAILRIFQHRNIAFVALGVYKPLQMLHRFIVDLLQPTRIRLDFLWIMERCMRKLW